MPVELPDHWLYEKALSPSDVGDLFHVHPRTVAKWADNAIIGFFRTPTGERRFPECEVRRIMAADPPPEWLKQYAEEDKKKYRELWQGGWRRNPKIMKVGDSLADSEARDAA